MEQKQTSYLLSSITLMLRSKGYCSGSTIYHFVLEAGPWLRDMFSALPRNLPPFPSPAPCKEGNRPFPRVFCIEEHFFGIGVSRDIIPFIAALQEESIELVKDFPFVTAVLLQSGQHLVRIIQRNAFTVRTDILLFHSSLLWEIRTLSTHAGPCLPLAVSWLCSCYNRRTFPEKPYGLLGWSPTGKAPGTSMFFGGIRRSIPPTHKALEGYPLRIHPRP